MRTRRSFGFLASASLVLLLSACVQEAEEHGLRYLLREKHTTDFYSQPPFVPLDRTVGDVNEQLQRWYYFRSSLPPDPFVYPSVPALLASLNDPFTFEVTPTGVVAMDRGTITLSKGFTVAHLDSLVYVNTIDPGGPAWRVGLRRNDIIKGLNQLVVDPTTTPSQVSVALSEDPLVVDVERAGAPLSFVVAGESFTTVTVEEADLDADTHYVRIGSFPQASVDPRGPLGELERILQANPTKSKWVVDLRWNGGGSLGQACEVADLFLTSGTITNLRDVNNNTYFTCAARVGGPGEGKQVVVLLNRSSASASEVIAAALRDRLGAQLVGEVSRGKGVAQTQFDYSWGEGRLLIVTHQVFSPNGVAWHGVGLTPDQAAALDPLLLVAGEDSQLTAARTSLGAGTTAPPVQAGAGSGSGGSGTVLTAADLLHMR